MTEGSGSPARERAGTLSIEELEAGLRTLDSSDVELSAFWDENIAAFRQTVLIAIRDTSDALLSPSMPLNWRLELEGQLEALVKYLELADRYMARRRSDRERIVERPRPRPPASLPRLRKSSRRRLPHAPSSRW